MPITVVTGRDNQRAACKFKQILFSYQNAVWIEASCDPIKYLCVYLSFEEIPRSVDCLTLMRAHSFGDNNGFMRDRERKREKEREREREHLNAAVLHDYNRK